MLTLVLATFLPPLTPQHPPYGGGLTHAVVRLGLRPIPCRGQLWQSPLSGGPLVAAPPLAHPGKGLPSLSVSYCLSLVCFSALPFWASWGRQSHVPIFVATSQTGCENQGGKLQAPAHKRPSLLSILSMPWIAPLWGTGPLSSVALHRSIINPLNFPLLASAQGGGHAPLATCAKTRGQFKTLFLTGLHWWFGLVPGIELRASGILLW